MVPCYQLMASKKVSLVNIHALLQTLLVQGLCPLGSNCMVGLLVTNAYLQDDMLFDLW